jgi:hypothetical protein
MARAIVVLLLSAFTLDAAIVDRVAVAPPRTEVRDTIGGPVVASGEAFLVRGQRISSDGIVLDAEPVAGADGRAVAWGDGWLVLSSRDDTIHVRHLPWVGAPELIHTIPSDHWLIDATSAGERLAILELGRTGIDQIAWLTVTDGTRILQRAGIGRAEDAKITRFGDGFLVVSWEREPDYRRTLRAWLFDRNGALVRFRTLETANVFSSNQVYLASLSHTAAIMTRNSSGTRFVVVDEALATVAAASLGSDADSIWWSTPLTVGDRFFLTYYRYDPTRIDRVVIVESDGTIVADEPTDPITWGDRAGDRYLVVRWWGDAAIAVGDPRTIVTPLIPLRQRVWESIPTLETTISDDVTLVSFGGNLPLHHVRVEADGAPIDLEPWLTPTVPGAAVRTSISATPDGFVFAWRDIDTIRMRRLARRGEWIDPEPVTLASAPLAKGIAIHANDRDVLLAWSTWEAIHWMRFAHDGAPIDLVPNRVAHVPTDSDYGSGDPTQISISGRGDERLVLVQDTFVCVILCAIPPLRLQALALDPGGQPLGPLTRVDARGSSRAAGLADGSWVLQVDNIDFASPAILRLARDGSVLDSTIVPALSGRIADVLPTENGWKAISQRPWRLVEMEGATTATRMTGLHGVESPRFASDGRLAFVDRSDELETVVVAWTGRVSAPEGDLALEVTELGVDAYFRYLGLTVHNRGSEDATNVYVASQHMSFQTEPVMIPLIRAGQSAHVVATIRFSSQDETIRVLSADIIDVDPSNNSATVLGAAPRPPRQRPARP